MNGVCVYDSAVMQTTESATSTEKAGVERRQSPRARLHTEAQLKSEQGSVTVTLLDLSLGGAAVLSDIPLQSGVDVDITFSLPYFEGTIEAKARVVWSDGMGHGGMHFEHMDESAKQKVTEFLLREGLNG